MKRANLVHEHAPLVISMGDPCGIGPEIIVKAWQALRGIEGLEFCVIGDANTLKSYCNEICLVDHIDQTFLNFHNALPVLNRPLITKAIIGHPDSAHAKPIINWIKEGFELCLSDEARGLITAPIAKSILYKSGFSFPGHTEYLEHLSREMNAQATAVMLLTAPDDEHTSPLRVALATIHLPLNEVANRLNALDLEALIRTVHEALRLDFGIEYPRICLAGFNPHAGENGDIGREDIEILRPVVERLRHEMNINGPFPADSLFHEEARKTYDCVICMYHDQGLIPLKMLNFWSGVNVTLGLCVVRTSPDHGTGFDIAGKNLARADSMIEAIKLANEISRRRLS